MKPLSSLRSWFFMAFNSSNLCFTASALGKTTTTTTGMIQESKRSDMYTLEREATPPPNLWLGAVCLPVNVGPVCTVLSWVSGSVVLDPDPVPSVD